MTPLTVKNGLNHPHLRQTKQELTYQFQLRTGKEKRPVLAKRQAVSILSKYLKECYTAIEFTRQIARLPNLRIKGLMTIGLLAPQPVLSRDSLRLLKTLSVQIKAEGIEGVEMRELSMGMSTDLEVAIEEGATMVRVGTDIFGRKSTPPGFFWNEFTDHSKI
ncbi:MAG: alanine racemase [Rhodospirillales bacterium]|nr:alanine racemase [Rhodospirillales bacterium]